MNYRSVTLHAEEAFTSDTTKVIDINIKQPISSLVVRLNAYASSATMAAHAVKCLSKIEIVDGSEVIYSLDGYEAQALDWYDLGGKFRNNWNACLNANGWVTHVGINFGRHLWDRVYALDPLRFNNLQLKIEMDIDAGGGSPGTIYVAVYANVFDERIPDLRGYLSAKEIKEWTMASGTHEYTDLPTDHRYRGLYLRAFLYGTEPDSCVANFKLSEDLDSKVPFNGDLIEIAALNMARYPKVRESYYYQATTSTSYLYVAPSNFVSAFVTPWTAAANDRSPACASSDGGRLPIIVNTGAINVQVTVEGLYPHCVFEVPFGMKDDPEDWYDVARIENLRADVEGNAAAAGFLFVQQERLY